MTAEKNKSSVSGGERLQKVLARAGLASRRAAEELIEKGRVRVDGQVVTELGVRVDPRTARIDVDGKRIAAEPFVYIVLNKPRGVMCTLKDPEGRPTVAELVRNAGARVVPVGRLDFHTSGALLMTNDGEFAAVLTHPRFHVPKVYVAKVKGVVDDRALARLRQSIDIDGVPTQPADVRLIRVEGDKSWLRVLLQEGKNRQVRRLGEAAGYPIMRLVREEHAGISTEGLRQGSWRQLGAEELAELKKAYGVPKRIHAPQPIDPRRRPRAGAAGAGPIAARLGKPDRSTWHAEGRPNKEAPRRPGKFAAQGESKEPRPSSDTARQTGRFVSRAESEAPRRLSKDALRRPGKFVVPAESDTRRPGKPSSHAGQGARRPGKPSSHAGADARRPGKPSSHAGPDARRPGKPSSHAGADARRPGKPSSHAGQGARKPSAGGGRGSSPRRGT